jgi:magnesium transporter
MNKKPTGGPNDSPKPILRHFSPLGESVDWVTSKSTSVFKRLNIKARKVGLPPGTLVHIGEQKTERSTVTLLNYDEQHVQERVADTIDDCLAYRDKPGVTWINLEGLHQIEVLQQLGEAFSLHPLVLEDILNTTQRPKLEDYSDYLYIVLKMIHYDEQSHQITAEQVSLIVMSSLVILFQEQAGDAFDPIRQRIRDGRGRIRKSNADYLTYTLLDAIVDSYFLILERLGEDIELLEAELIDEANPQTLQEIYNLKRELIFLHRSIWPLREVVHVLSRGESNLFTETTTIYLRDVYDHTVQVIDLVETYRELVTGMLDLYLSSLSNRMNMVMKVLTVIATLFIPLTFITSLYGMNFKYMPELEWRWGYTAVWLVILLVTLSMLAFFKRKKWL